MHLWNVAPHKVLDTLESHKVELPATVFSPTEECTLGTGNFRSVQLRELLSEKQRSCLIDPFGRILLIADGNYESPIRNSILELIRGYTALRRHIFNDGLHALPHPRTCSILKLEAPNSSDEALLQFGAAGSFLAARRYPLAAPLLMYIDGVDERIADWTDMLPDFYREVVGVTAGRFDPNTSFTEYTEQRLQSTGRLDEGTALR